MLKSKGPLKIAQKTNAAHHFESTLHIAEPAFEPTAMLQQKEDSQSNNRDQMNEKSSLSHSSPNEKLPNQLRTKMENAFDSDFSNVHIETNSSKAQHMGANAFAQGNTISFAPGSYDPVSKHGQNLIGHELTHVVQQRSQNIPVTQQYSGININNDMRLEREADQKGELAANGEKTGMSSENNQVQRSVTQGFGWNDGKNFLEKMKNTGKDKVSKAANWGIGKANDVKGFGLNKGHEIWSDVKEKANEGKERLEEKKQEALGKLYGIPEINIHLIRSLANAAVDNLKYKVAEIDNRFKTKLLPIVQRLKTFINRNVDPAQIIQMITHTLHRILEFIKKKINEVKDRLEDAADLEIFANFFKYLINESMENKDDLVKFIRLLMVKMDDAYSGIFNKV